MAKIAVYGSLRKGEYNYNRFKQLFPDIKVVDTTITITDFALYDLQFGYPGIKREKDAKLVVDILEVNDMCEDMLDNMELGAGYHIEYIKIKNETIKIYVYDGKVKDEHIVENGDWSHYISSKE